MSSSAIGWCGNTDAHKNAQASTKYDYGTCVPTPGRCGPFFCNGWCGSTSAYANAKPSTKFDYAFYYPGKKLIDQPCSRDSDCQTGACGQDCTFGDCQQSKPPTCCDQEAIAYLFRGFSDSWSQMQQWGHFRDNRALCMMRCARERLRGVNPLTPRSSQLDPPSRGNAFPDSTVYHDMILTYL
eukprot:g73469.t1